MVSFCIRRLLAMLATLFVASVIAFAVPFIGGRDPALAILHSRLGEIPTDPAVLHAQKVALGLDQPVVIQYLRWLGQVLSGDLGFSYASGDPVAALLGSALYVSLLLAACALLLALVVAIPVGIIAAQRRGGMFDRIVTVVSQGFVAMPEYWLAPMGILVFALWLGILPSAGWSDPRSIVMPAVVLSLRPMAYLARVSRAAMTDVIGSKYMLAARARGLGPAKAILRHGIRNALPPVMTLFALWLTGMLGGSVIVEVIFAVPGMGPLIYGAVMGSDIPLMQAAVLTIVGLAVCITTLADLAFMAVSPSARGSASVSSK